jgi:peptidoglycan/LPS O-acetylase OafA/YrhL
LDGLLWGCLAAIYYPAIQREVGRIRFSQLWLPISALLVAIDTLRIPGTLLWHAILLPALVLSTILQPASWLARILEWRLLRWVGSLSYGLYLWQELFLPQSPFVTARGWFHYLQAWPANIIAIVACAWASRYLLEGPMILLGRHLMEGKTDTRRPVPITVLPLPGMAEKYSMF